MSDREWSRRSQISAVGTTGTSAALNGDIIDMASNGGFNSVIFTAVLAASGNATATGPKLVMQMGTASGSLSDATGDVQGTKTTIYLDVDQPIKRFVRGVLRNGSATQAYETLITQVYNARSLPTTQPASSTGQRVYSPGSGTATG